MTKLEIIKTLDKEVSLFKETEDENSLGELYLTSLEFKKAEDALYQIERRRIDIEKHLEELKKIINSNERFTVLNDVDALIVDKVINFPTPLIILQSRDNKGHLTMMGCTLQNLPKEIT
jgi:hypothetical protein